MNKQQLIEHMEAAGMRPGRALGQNFLLDGNLLEYIVRTARIRPGEVILETGPGFGALTRLMLAAGAVVYAIEYDHRLAAYLRADITDPNFHLIEGDACKVDFMKELPPGVPFRSIANLPYSISTVFIARLLELPEPPVQMIFMLQKEMGQRLAASPGTKNYGTLSIRTQLLYDTRLLRIVPPEVFCPPPEVESALVGFDLRPDLPTPHLRKYLPGVAKTVFSQRRKQMGKVLGQTCGRERALAALAAAGFPPEIRPDKLTVDDFRRLTLALYPEKEEEKKS